MTMKTPTSASILASCFLLTSCAILHTSRQEENTESQKPQLSLMAESEHQWTGVTVAPDGSLFVSYPRWSDTVPVSVQRINPENPSQRSAFPNEEWNNWTEGADPANHFICVQSVVADSQNRLWVLDPANPEFSGVVPNGPKLVAFDIETGEVVQKFVFDERQVPENSYLNDVRIDTRHQTAYISDSHAAAILVVDLRTGYARRLLHDDPSVHSEKTPVTINGKTWGEDQESLPDVHVDGIALDRERNTLYYHALTGTRLYKIRSRWLRDPAMSAERRRQRVQTVAETGPVDGMLFVPGQGILLTDLENNAITAVDRNGSTKTLIQDPRLAWPDTLAASPDGTIYVTTSQIHRTPNPPSPYRLFRITLPEQPLK